MTPRTFIILPLLLLAAPAYAEDTANLSFGCAPWDGTTLDLSVPTPDSLITVSIWDKGYDDLVKGGKTVVIDNRTLSPQTRDVTGQAREISKRISLESPPHFGPVNLTVHFDVLDLKAGGDAAGWIQKPGEAQIPFKGTIASSMARCG